jgi:hypothetical protein
MICHTPRTLNAALQVKKDEDAVESVKKMIPLSISNTDTRESHTALHTHALTAARR